MNCPHAVFVLYRFVKCHTADAHHFCIVIHTSLVADVLFQQVFVFEGIVVQRQAQRQGEYVRIEPVELQQKLIKVSHYHVITVCYWRQKFILHLL